LCCCVGGTTSQYVTQTQLAEVIANLRQYKWQRSYQTACQIGKNILDDLGSTKQCPAPFLGDWLPPLKSKVLEALLIDSQAAAAWDELKRTQALAQARHVQLQDSPVQEFYEVLLSRLHSLYTPHNVHVLVTKESGVGRKKPDICVSASPVKTPVELLYTVEVKSSLANETKRQEATAQCYEQAELILDNQQGRQTCYAVVGAADAIELWRYAGNVAEACSQLLPLSWQKDSAGLQALVRLWSMPQALLGYTPRALPEVACGSDRLENVTALTINGSEDADQAPQLATTVLLGTWKGEQVVAKTSRRIDEEVHLI